MRNKGLYMFCMIILIFVLIFSFAACGGNPNQETNPGEQDQGGTQNNNNDTESSLKDFTGLSFSNKSIDYDGKEHEILVEGELNGATVTYANNKGTNAGTYNASATIKKEGFNDLTLTATLTINKIDLATAIVFNDKTFEYDSKEHKISVEGLIPEGVSVSYTGGENKTNGATNVGSYEITATISGTNYNTITLTATITIKSTEEDLNVVLYKGNLYFQNPLHHNYLYSYDNTEVKKISSDSPTSYAVSNDILYFFSKGLISTSICSFNGEKVTPLIEVNGENLITDGANLYYTVNSLISKEKSGIYRISISDLNNKDADPVATKVCGDKAETIAFNNGFIYYINKDNGNKLFRVDATATKASGTLVYDYKVSELMANGNKLYFNRHNNLTAAIYSIDLTSNPTMPIVDDSEFIKKLSASKGKDFTIINDELYFLNIDMVTSTIFGNGIYKVKENGVGVAKKVIEAQDNSLYALTGNDNAIYYYKNTDKHLYQYDLASEQENDLMENFVIPEELNVITTYYEKTMVHNNEIYFINMQDGGKLYKYDTVAGEEYRITGLEVADFTINGDYLYYSTVRLFTNFDVYRINLVSGEMDLVSTEKCYHLIFDNEWIYYLNFSGNNTLNKMKLDGTENTILYEDKKVADRPITLKDNKIYFVDDPKLGYKSMLAYDLASGKVSEVNKGTCTPKEYLIDGDKLIVVNAQKNNSLEIRDLKTKEILNTVELGLDEARGLTIINNELYFYRNVAAGSVNKGLYKLDLTDNAAQAVLVDNMVREGKTYYASEIVVINEELYFVDEWQVANSVPEPTNSTGKLCKYNLNNKEITELN